MRKKDRVIEEKRLTKSGGGEKGPGRGRYIRVLGEIGERSL